MENKNKKEKEKGRITKRNLKKIFSFKVVSRFSIILCFVLGFSFVIGVNDLSIKGFVLQELKKDVKSISNENKMLEISIMELESYEKISERAGEIKMVKVDSVDYVSFTPGVVAKK